MKKSMFKEGANIILIIGIVLTLIGAMYIAFILKGYAVAGCFVGAAVLMSLLLKSGKKK